MSTRATHRAAQVPGIISVGLGELRISQDTSTILVAHGLGSCVGVCAYDPAIRLGGLLHAMLPTPNGNAGANPTKYVDLGIEELLKEMAAAGALRGRLLIYVAGGAQMLIAPGFKNTLNIGERNAETALAVLRREKLPIAAHDIGGHWGRTVKLHVDSGSLIVRSAGKGEQELTVRRR